MKLAEILNTSTSYIGEIEINNKIPSLDMVERIAKALKIEPFRLFVNDMERTTGDTLAADNFLEQLTTAERQTMANRIIALISNEVEQILNPESKA